MEKIVSSVRPISPCKVRLVIRLMMPIIATSREPALGDGHHQVGLRGDIGIVGDDEVKVADRRDAR